MTSFTVESWTWYGFAISMVILRFTARIVHFKSIFRLQVDDWLMVFLSCLYTILIAFLNVDATVNTNLIDPADIPSLTPQDIAQRTWGSKTVLLVEQCMCAVQWGTKACLLILYWRLTHNLRQNLIVKLTAIYVAVTYVVMEVLYFGYWCRPFHDYWQTPTDNVQCTTALHHLIVNLSFNLSSDLLIMSIPIPLFLKAHLELKRKLLLIFPFLLGAFTILCAILSKHLSFTQPFSGYWVFWYCRESSTAMIVTNMPYAWTLLRQIFNLKSFLGDSDDEVPQTVTLQGMTMQEAALVSTNAQAMNRGSRFFPGRKSRTGSIALANSNDKAVNMKSWQDTKTSMDADVNTTAEPSSSGNSVAKASVPVSDTATVLDKLYPLDDDDELALVGRRRNLDRP